MGPVFRKKEDNSHKGLVSIKIFEIAEVEAENKIQKIWPMGGTIQQLDERREQYVKIRNEIEKAKMKEWEEKSKELLNHL